jgi:hypothetical protein
MMSEVPECAQDLATLVSKNSYFQQMIVSLSVFAELACVKWPHFFFYSGFKPVGVAEPISQTIHLLDAHSHFFWINGVKPLSS